MVIIYFLKSAKVSKDQPKLYIRLRVGVILAMIIMIITITILKSLFYMSNLLSHFICITLLAYAKHFSKCFTCN